MIEMRLRRFSIFGPNWRAICTGDFDRDNNLDIAFQHTDGSLAVWFMEGIIRRSASYLNPQHPGDVSPRSGGQTRRDQRPRRKARTAGEETPGNRFVSGAGGLAFTLRFNHSINRRRLSGRVAALRQGGMVAGKWKTEI